MLLSGHFVQIAASLHVQIFPLDALGRSFQGCSSTRGKKKQPRAVNRSTKEPFKFEPTSTISSMSWHSQDPQRFLFFHGPIQTHLHTSNSCWRWVPASGRSGAKHTFKTRYRLYAGTFIPHGWEPADWNIALQMVQLSVQAVERTLDKTALLVLTKEEFNYMVGILMIRIQILKSIH
jgi:hypothetical protein